MSRGNPNNLIPNTDLTPEELSERNRRAGIASGEARREKKRMSQIYAEFLEKEHDVGTIDEPLKLSGHALLSAVMSKILARGDAASVGLMREIRETLEGKDYNHNGEIEIIFKNLTKKDVT